MEHYCKDHYFQNSIISIILFWIMYFNLYISIISGKPEYPEILEIKNLIRVYIQIYAYSHIFVHMKTNMYEYVCMLHNRILLP